LFRQRPGPAGGGGGKSSGLLLPELESRFVQPLAEHRRRVTHALLAVSDDLARPGLIQRRGHLLQQPLKVRAQRLTQLPSRDLLAHIKLLDYDSPANFS
jgi:hypothetical protein